MMGRAFDAGALGRQYSYLGTCPSAVLDAVILLPVGTLEERVAGARSWRDALLAGELPSPGTWPPHSIGGPVRQALQELGLLRFLKGQPDLVDELLVDIFRSFSRGADQIRREVSERLLELERLERETVEREELARAAREEREARPTGVSPEALERLRRQAALEVESQVRGADAGLADAWGERARAWAAIADVFGDLGELMGRGWDLTRGVLRHTGWNELLKLRQLLERLPELREVVQSLGRLHAGTEAEESVAERVMGAVTRLEEELREVPTPLVPAETRGVERSGEIARMLPVEALMLGHSTLRFLWHARRAERALLTYRVEGVESERTWAEREFEVESAVKRPRPERGPIIAVLDTSGSMHGLPERVAKALVLEALRVAHSERRRCLLFAYSGPGQILEHELSLTQDGVGRLLEFLGFSFGGGNDEVGVLLKVLQRIKSEEWKRADVVFVSDGEWPAPSAVVDGVRDAREGGTRFHGVQIGNRGRTGLHAVCDPVHEFRDWAQAGGW